MTVEGAGTPSTSKKAKAKAPARKMPLALPAGKPLPPRNLGKVMGRTARSIGPRAMTFRSVTRLSSMSRNKGQNMISVTRKNVRMPLVERAEAMKQIALANPFGNKENLPGVKRRKSAMM